MCFCVRDEGKLDGLHGVFRGIGRNFGLFDTWGVTANGPRCVHLCVIAGSSSSHVSYSKVGEL